MLDLADDVALAAHAHELARRRRIARGAARDLEDRLHGVVVGLVRGSARDLLEADAEVVGHEVVHLLEAPSAAADAGLDDEPRAPELVDVAVERVGRPVERGGDLGDRAGRDHAHRLDDLEAHGGDEDRPVLRLRDMVDGGTGHRLRIDNCCLSSSKANG